MKRQPFVLIGFFPILTVADDGVVTAVDFFALIARPDLRAIGLKRRSGPSA